MINNNCMAQLKNRIIVTGHFGCGKTEFALNLAFLLKETGQPVTIVDFDVVNPYFRTNDVKTELEAQGIQVVSPPYAGTNVDMPTLPPEFHQVFHRPGYVLFDVGGDEDGARALGQFHAQLTAQEYTMLYLANLRRPLTGAPEEIAENLRAVEQASRLKATGLVNSTNLSYLTQPETILDSIPAVERAGELTGLPVSFLSVKEEIARQLPEPYQKKIIPIAIRITVNHGLYKG